MQPSTEIRLDKRRTDFSRRLFRRSPNPWQNITEIARESTIQLPQRGQHYIDTCIRIETRMLKQRKRVFTSLYFPFPPPVQCHEVAADIEFHGHSLPLAGLKIDATERNQLLFWLRDGGHSAQKIDLKAKFSISIEIFEGYNTSYLNNITSSWASGILDINTKCNSV